MSRHGHPPVIEVRDLRFTYPRARSPALDALSFTVGRGEIFGFLGPSGAGKSTTQRVLTGLVSGHQGEVCVLGSAIGALGRDFYDRIGVAFEVPNLYGKLTGRENLAFFASLHDAATESPAALLELVGLAAAADERVEAYSKGMRMRLNFARSLLTTPDLLFLDEPTTGQDPENARRIRDIIRDRRAAGATVFLTTHDMNLATGLCDRVAFIVDGRIALVGAPRDLMVRYGARRVRVEHRVGDRIEREEFELDGLGHDEAFLRLLREGRVETLHSLDATLEDVFLDVTGRRLT